MNQVPDLKLEKLNQKLTNTELSILKYATGEDDKQIRFLIDAWRHLSALLNREISVRGSKQDDPALVYVPNPDVKQFIEAWCNRLKHTEIGTVSYESYEFCDLMLDHVLPKAWNFDEDLVVVHQPQSSHLLNAIQNRTQKHIIIYNVGQHVPADVQTFAQQNMVTISHSIEDLERSVSILQTRAQQVISISCDCNANNVKKVKLEIADAVNAGKRTRVENTATASKFGQTWAVNILKNLPKMQSAKNLHQLMVSGVEDAIIVASGPSLSKNVNQLKAIQDKIFIVAALRSLPILNAAGIEADLVIQLDAENDIVAQQLSPNSMHPIRNLLLEGTVNPAFFGMPAKNIIWSLPQHFFDIHEKFSTLPTPFNVPSVSIYGLCLCQFLNFKNICFIGQDLAASNGKQYADGATDLLPAQAKMSMFQIEVPGFYGGTVLTRNSYEYQIKRCAEIAREWRSRGININLVNATEGGAYIPEFDHMTLDNFVEQHRIMEKKAKKSISFLSEYPIGADELASFSRNIRDIMSRISSLADIIIRLDSKAERTHGLEKKMKKTIQKFKKLNDSTSLLQIAMQDSIAKVIGTSRTTETIDNYAQFFAKIKVHSESLRNAINN